MKKPIVSRSRSSGWSAGRTVLLLLAALAAAVLPALVVPAPGHAAAGDVGVEGPSHSGTNTPTGTKRGASVLWFNDGTWWGNLWDTGSQDFHIFRLDAATQQWADTGVTTETRADTQHDVLWDGTTLYVASHRFVNDEVAAASGFPSTLRRYSYNSSTDTYTPLGSSQINNYRTETLVIDKDTTGRVWATWQQGNKIWLNVTGTDGATWGTPFPHPDSASGSSPANVSVDDNSALIAFGPGKVGLLWSKQTGTSSDGFYWSVHTDGAGTSTWSTPAPAVTGLHTGDDHMNLKWLDSSGGRVFAAVKTSFTSSSQPLIQLLAMAADGSWTAHTIATVSECPNRVIAMIDEAAQRIRTFATYPKPSGTTNGGVCSTSGGAIYEKSTPLNDIGFTSAKTVRILDVDQYAHNISSTKQNLNNSRSGGLSTTNSGLLVIASVSATSRYWHYYDGPSSGGPTDTTPPTVTAVSPVDGATGVSVSTNVTATFSEAVDPATVNGSTFTLSSGSGTVPAAVGYDAATRTATLNPSSDLAAGTYTARVLGGGSGVKDPAGNALASDRTWSFTVPSTGGGGGTETVTVTATEDTYVVGTAATTNFGNSTVLGVDASPVTVSYLKFELGPYAGRTVSGATLELRATTSGSQGTQNVKMVGDDSWTETGLVFGNRPALGSTLGSLGPTAKNTGYTVPLTAAALQPELGGTLSLGLDSASTDGVNLASTETTTPPRLVLTVNDDGVPGEPDSTPPTVTAVSPVDGATGVPVSTNVTATFSEAVEPATVNGSTFTLSSGSGTVPAAVGYDAGTRTATLNPSSDLAGGVYTARVVGGSAGVQDTSGNDLAADKVWSFSVPTTGGGGETVTLTATEDTYVAGDLPTTNFGTGTLLGVDASPVQVSYLKFDLGAYAGRTVTGATLELRVTSSGSTGTQSVKLVADDSWTETGLLFGNRPPPGATLGTLGPTSRDTGYSVLLTASALQPELGGVLSLGLDSTSSDGVDLASRETTTPPRLVLTLQ